MRALVIHPGAVGDVLLALPALAHLGTLGGMLARPLHRVLAVGPWPRPLHRVLAVGPWPRPLHRVLAVGPRLAALLAESPCAEEAVELDGLPLSRLFETDPDPQSLAPFGGFDVIVSWLGAGDHTYRANLTRLARRVVVARAAPPLGSRRHASHHLLATLAPLGPVSDRVAPVRVAAGAAEREWVARWLEERGLGRGEPVLIHPGAGGQGKVWPGYADLIRRLEASGRPVVATTGPAEACAASSRVATDPPLRRLAALAEASRAFVGNDSGPTHLAAAVGCPTLALFGPTDSAVWAPLGPDVRVLAGAGPGAPDPWDGLTVERVEAELARVRRPSPVPDVKEVLNSIYDG